MESILTSIKKLLGIDETFTQFDIDVMIFINSAFMSLYQLGIGPSGGYKITDDDNTWDEVTDSRIDLEGVKTFIYLKTRLMFDPPQMGFLVEAIKDQIRELEWRLNVQIESIDSV